MWPGSKSLPPQSCWPLTSYHLLSWTVNMYKQMLNSISSRYRTTLSFIWKRVSGHLLNAIPIFTWFLWPAPEGNIWCFKGSTLHFVAQLDANCCWGKENSCWSNSKKLNKKQWSIAVMLTLFTQVVLFCSFNLRHLWRAYIHKLSTEWDKRDYVSYYAVMEMLHIRHMESTLLPLTACSKTRHAWMTEMNTQLTHWTSRKSQTSSVSCWDETELCTFLRNHWF